MGLRYVLDLLVVVVVCGWESRWCFFFQAEDGIRDLVRSRGLGDVYKRQTLGRLLIFTLLIGLLLLATSLPLVLFAGLLTVAGGGAGPLRGGVLLGCPFLHIPRRPGGTCGVLVGAGHHKKKNKTVVQRRSSRK